MAALSADDPDLGAGMPVAVEGALVNLAGETLLDARFSGGLGAATGGADFVLASAGSESRAFSGRGDPCAGFAAAFAGVAAVLSCGGVPGITRAGAGGGLPVFGMPFAGETGGTAA